jgi:hypothetical protein
MAALADWIDRWVLTYATESDLWPVAVALLGHVSLGIAGLVLIGLRTGSVLAWALVGGFAAVTLALAAIEVRRRSPGRAVGALALTWVGAAAMAWFGDRTGVL